MSDNTHYFAANVADHHQVKQLLAREHISAILDLCEHYSWLNLGPWDERAPHERWLIIVTRTENWDGLTTLIDKLIEILHCPGRFWEFVVSWKGRVLGASFFPPDSEGEHSTVLSKAEIDFFSAFFGKDPSRFERFLSFEYPAEFCDAVGIPFLQMVDQDMEQSNLEAAYPHGYVLYAHEIED